jgi:hypothetical protein
MREEGNAGFDHRFGLAGAFLESPARTRCAQTACRVSRNTLARPARYTGPKNDDQGRNATHEM